MAEVNSYIDPDATGEGDGTSFEDAYTSSPTWESTEQTDLTVDTDTHIAHTRALSGTAETTRLVISGWTQSATYYLTYRCHPDYRHAGVLDATKHRFALSCPYNGAVEIADAYTRAYGIQIDNTYSGSGTSRALYTTGDALIIGYFIVLFSNTPTGTSYGINTTGSIAATTHKLYNNLVYDVPGSAFSVSGENDSNELYNNTAVDSTTGFASGWDDITVMINNCAFNCTDCYSASSTGTTTHNAYSEGSDPGSSGVDISAEAGTDLFNDYNNNDFTLKSGSALIGVGTDDPGSGLYSDDIKGDARSSTWDIGAAEYVAAAGDIVVLRRRRAA